uniref:PTS sugar transporter subunit IIA n=1 Tax=Eiseniibacteriota bacterium TaxID=2212470 RepID=A0A832I3I6_UNCEI
MTTDTIHSALDTSLDLVDLRHRRKEGVLEELARVARAAGVARDADVLRDALVRRERAYSSAVGKGVALPHARSIAVSRPRMLVARAPRGVEWGAADGQPVQIVVLTLAPAETGDEAWHGMLARAAGAVRLARQRQRLLEAADVCEAAAVLAGENP